MTNAERKHRISEAWSSTFGNFRPPRKIPVIPHRLIFSMSNEMHDALVDAGINPDRVLHSSDEENHAEVRREISSGDSIGYAYGMHHDTDTPSRPRRALPAHGERRVCRDAARPGSSSRGTRSRWTFSAPGSSGRISGGRKFFNPPRNGARSLSRRIDSDKIVFAPRLNAAHLEALRNAQTAEAIRLQQSYRSIRNLEAAIATKRQVLRAKRNVNFVSRLMGRRKPKAHAHAGKTRRRR